GSAITQAVIPTTFTVLPETGAETTPVRDLSVVTFSAATFTAGAPPSVSVFPGEGTADGYFTIPNVPTGTNYVFISDVGWLFTSTRKFDLTFLLVGRPDLEIANAPTPVTLTVSGLLPRSDAGTDTIEMYTIGGATDFYMDVNAPGSPDGGQTSASIVNDFNGDFLLDTTQGDQVV